MSRGTIARQAADVLGPELQPGEHVVAGAAVSSDPPRWVAVALLPVALLLVAAGLTAWLGPEPSPLLDAPVIGLALPVLGLGVQFGARPMYVAATGQRLICHRLSWLRRAPGRLIFAVPLADVRVVNYRSSKHRISMQCEIPGPRRIRLTAGRAQRQDFAAVDLALARSGAFRKLDPPYHSAANS